jgi:hypothetical protein
MEDAYEIISHELYHILYNHEKKTIHDTPIIVVRSRSNK